MSTLREVLDRMREASARAFFCGHEKLPHVYRTLMGDIVECIHCGHLTFKAPEDSK